MRLKIRSFLLTFCASYAEESPDRAVRTCKCLSVKRVQHQVKREKRLRVRVGVAMSLTSIVVSRSKMLYGRYQQSMWERERINVQAYPLSSPGHGTSVRQSQEGSSDTKTETAVRTCVHRVHHEDVNHVIRTRWMYQ